MWDLAWQRCRNEGSRSDPAFEVTFGTQLGIGVEDWKTGYFEIFGQVPARGDLLSGLQIAMQNCGTEAFADLTVQRKRIETVDRDDGGNS